MIPSNYISPLLAMSRSLLRVQNAFFSASAEIINYPEFSFSERSHELHRLHNRQQCRLVVFDIARDQIICLALHC